MTDISNEYGYRDVDDNIICQIILSILSKHDGGLSSREILEEAHLYGLNTKAYTIIDNLRSLIKNGNVSTRCGKWQIINHVYQDKNLQNTLRSSSLPRLSSVATAILGFVDATDNASEYARARNWKNFRKLLNYYTECVRSEEHAEAMAFGNEENRRFIYLRGIGKWAPCPDTNWYWDIPLCGYNAPFLNSLADGLQTEDNILLLGYPLQAIPIRKEGEPDQLLIKPVFQYALSYSIGPGFLRVKCDSAKIEENSSWLGQTFKNDDRKRGFLSACGLMPANEELAEDLVEPSSPSLESLITVLEAFLPDRICERLDLEAVADRPLPTTTSLGIHNRAVLMLGRRSKYSRGLLRELALISQASDEELDRTALRPIFLGSPPVETAHLVPAGEVLDSCPLNAEQMEAVNSLLINPVTVVTGPPGTGKSQVIRALMANARLKGQSVLFASRNHKALEAVLERAHDEEGRPFVQRTVSKADPLFKYTFTHALRELLSGKFDAEASIKLTQAQEELSTLLRQRGDKAHQLQVMVDLRDQLGAVEFQLSNLVSDLQGDVVDTLDKRPLDFPAKEVEELVTFLLNFEGARRRLTSLSAFLLRLFPRIPAFIRVAMALRRIPNLAKLALVFKGGPMAKNAAQSLQSAAKYARLRADSLKMERHIASLDSIENLSSEIVRISKLLREKTSCALTVHVSASTGLPRSTDRERLAGLRSALIASKNPLADSRIASNARETLRESIPILLERFPCWSTTHLSVSTRIPCLAGMFDLAVIDEASQSDIASAIPILFRARRAGVVGDPFQLTHVTRLTPGRDVMLRSREGLTNLDDQRFSFRDTSLFDLFAQTNGVEPIFLAETYRSIAEIAEYSNVSFYAGRLRVATDPGTMQVPHGMSPGIQWTDLASELRSGGASGCVAPMEVDAVVRLVRTILADNSFKGTLGVVTPFRQQANRLRDAIFESGIPVETLRSAEIVVDTAHGFQGDEKDVIIFSLCGGASMPVGSLAFLRETGDLFNVAVSRARALLHVVGNREWARRSGIPHIEALARPRAYVPTEATRGPWYPHESPWEKRLYDALFAEGLLPTPQYPVGSRRLDLAMVRGDSEEGGALKLDIEVDGDCHRSADGSRRIEDIWRDITLQGMGWKVLRFWVYQLREDLPGCVRRVTNVWRAPESNRDE